MLEELFYNPIIKVILYFLMTFIPCSLPMIIYRFVIRKYSVERRPAKIVCSLYGVFVYALTFLITYFSNRVPTSSLLILEFVWLTTNYKTLTHEGENDYQHIDEKSTEALTDDLSENGISKDPIVKSGEQEIEILDKANADNKEASTNNVGSSKNDKSNKHESKKMSRRIYYFVAFVVAIAILFSICFLYKEFRNLNDLLYNAESEVAAAQEQIAYLNEDLASLQADIAYLENENSMLSSEVNIMQQELEGAMQPEQYWITRNAFGYTYHIIGCQYAIDPVWGDPNNIQYCDKDYAISNYTPCSYCNGDDS